MANQNSVIKQANTRIEYEGFSVGVQIANRKVMIIIDDKDRVVSSSISGISVISIYKDHDAIRVSSDYKIREV
jgi:hypothetical protein